MSAIDRRSGAYLQAAIKLPCRVVSVANITLSGLQTIDGVALAESDRVLVTAQTVPSENGIYVADTGGWARSADCNGPRDLVFGTIVVVTSGTLNARSVWEVTTILPAIGSALTWAVMGAGALALASAFMLTVLDDTTAGAARTTLGAVGLTGNETVAGIKAFTGANTHAGNEVFTGAVDMTAGTPTVPTAAVGTSTTAAASTAWVNRSLGGAAIRSYLAGLQLTGRTNTTISYGAGVCADSTNAAMLVLAAGTINCATVGANGLDAGALANTTWYHVYAISTAAGATAFLASTNVSTPTMPSGYTLKRRIGSFKTNGAAQILDMIQSGDTFSWVVATTDFSANPLTTPVTLNVPTGLSVTWIGDVGCINSGGLSYFITLYDFGVTTSAKSVTAFVTPTANVSINTPMQIRTNTTAQIVTSVSGSPGGATVLKTCGWIDRRGRDD